MADPRKLTYPPALVDRLHPVLEAAQHGLPLPTKTQLGEVLGIAWAATMLEEEGRRTVFTLACIGPEELAERKWASASPFAHAVPCEPARIAKLAPAADPRETMLGVRWTEQGQPEIWGLVYVGDPSILMDYNIGLAFVRIVGFKPGGFVVEAMMQRFLMYSGGDARWYEADSDTIPSLFLESQLLDSTAQHLGGADDDGAAVRHESGAS